MNKSDLRSTARDIVMNREANYWNVREDEDQKEDNWLTKRQNKMLSDSDNYEKNVKREYAILINNNKEYKKINLRNLPDSSGSKKWFNHIGVRGEYVPVEEITEELEEKEEEWWITYSEFLHDNK